MEKLLLLGLLTLANAMSGQQKLTGKIFDQKNKTPISDVVLKIKNKNISAKSDTTGAFYILIPDNDNNANKDRSQQDTLQISHKDYITQNIAVSDSKEVLNIYLIKKINRNEHVKEIDEVVINTGYQKITKEAGTGSYSVIDKTLFNKQTSVNILDRLAATANAVTVDKATSDDSGQIMIRGLSTIKGLKSPLIILDNFPYEGNINNINPSIVESISILKDAAASSIWGARAANGVIVITTKKAKNNQKISVDISSSIAVGNKPNFSKIPQMTSNDFIDVEQELFKRGFYDNSINSPEHPVISPVVDLLNKVKSGAISQQDAQYQINQLRQVDVRDQYKKYMYRNLENRQYAISISSGSSNLSWLSSLAYDDNAGNLDEKYKRMNLFIQNTWKPNAKLTFNTSLFFNQNTSQSGRSAYSSISVANNGLPYMRFADDFGNPLVVFKQYNQQFKDSFDKGKLQDWNYYPLTDWQHNTSTSKTNEILLSSALNYNIIKGLDADFKYQYQYQNSFADNLADEYSYYARNYVNLFSSIDQNGVVTYNVPRGGILSKSVGTTTVNNFRGQLNFSRKFGMHDVTAFFGGESKMMNTKYQNNLYYGYQASNMSFSTVNYNQAYALLNGSYGFIDNNNSLSEKKHNFLSAFANVSYTYDNRYTISGSARQDASNLFGLATNDQWNPFWSTGVAWHLSNENIFKNFAISKFLPNVKLRASVGHNGNIDPSMVAMTTISYLSSNSPFTGQPMAVFSNFYNPKLRWESVKIWNAGLDVSALNNRINATVELFQKKSDNLFGNAPMDYTTGITDLVWNVAGMKGRGLDVQLRTINISVDKDSKDSRNNEVGIYENKKFQWSTLINFSTYKDEITAYYLNNTFGRQFVTFNVPVSGLVGLPVYSIFAYKFAGLDPTNGDPLGYLNGEISKDYNKITGTGTDVKDLQYFGSAIPTVYGNFTNNFTFKQFSLDIGITYKFGYWFRRPSINYTKLFTEWQDHSDYANRWQKSGDEAFTNIPSNTYETNSNRDAFFAGSSALVEKGDHIRLQYINLAYKMRLNTSAELPLKGLELFFNINNLGILWKASKTNIDPDFNIGRYNIATPAIYTFGFKANF